MAAPYDNAEYVLNLARSIVNDASVSLTGSILADTQPYTIPMLNSCYRDLQRELVNRGVETFVKEAILTGLLACTSNDPAVQVYLSFTGYFDGTTLQVSPTLPSDLVMPIRLWERQSGMTSSPFRQLQPTNDGLPTITQTGRMVYWEWKNDSIYFPGATQSNDLRMRYWSFLPDIALSTDTIQIFDAANCLAHKLGKEFGSARGSPLAQYMAAESDRYLQQIVNRTARKKQRGQHRRRPQRAGQNESARSDLFSGDDEIVSHVARGQSFRVRIAERFRVWRDAPFRRRQDSFRRS